jgi:hypothetical protein
MLKKDYYENLCKINKKAFSMFEKYKRDSTIFIETGCHDGNTCVKAAVLGYGEIYSCDINENSVTSAKNKLADFECKSQIHNLRSIDFLNLILPTLDGKATFWLDAHGWGGDVALFDELKTIKKFDHCNNATILIDDIQLFFKDKIEEIKNEISTINPDYIFEFANLHESGKDDVLIAYIQGE